MRSDYNSAKAVTSPAELLNTLAIKGSLSSQALFIYRAWDDKDGLHDDDKTNKQKREIQLDAWLNEPNSKIPTYIY